MAKPITQEFIDRFREIGFAVSRATGCWVWLGQVGHNGYGRIGIKKKGIKMNLPAHRVSCAAYGKEVPNTLVSDHLCRNRLCVNPNHIDFCTNQENMARGIKGVKWEKKKCLRGHLFTPQNTRIYGRRRVCVKCMNEHWRAK